METTPYTYWSNFLDHDLVELIRSTVRTNLNGFVSGRVSQARPENQIEQVIDSDFRSSSVLFHFAYPEIHRRYSQRVKEFYPYWSDFFKLPLHPDQNYVEVQCTGHGDGDFFNFHEDNQSVDTAHRILTVVYYFDMHDDQRYTGGTLEMKTGEIITPRHNHVVAFESHKTHRVNKVSVPSRDFFDGRYTLNGWLHNRPGL